MSAVERARPGVERVTSTLTVEKVDRLAAPRLVRCRVADAEVSACPSGPHRRRAWVDPGPIGQRSACGRTGVAAPARRSALPLEFRAKALDELVGELGWPGLRFHDLRATAIVLWIGTEVPADNRSRARRTCQLDDHRPVRADRSKRPCGSGGSGQPVHTPRTRGSTGPTSANQGNSAD
jgi:hypothetical protein